MPVQVGIDVKEFTSQFGTAHIFQPEEFTVRVGTDNDVLVFRGFAETAFVSQYVFQ
ncbi:hypothetical protein D3C86_1899310 [compost metagenome]